MSNQIHQREPEPESARTVVRVAPPGSGRSMEFNWLILKLLFNVG
jgi:hypothetical protein